MATKTEDLNFLFSELHVITYAVPKLIRQVAYEFDMLPLELDSGNMPNDLFRSPFAHLADSPHVVMSDSNLRLIIRALPEYRAFMARAIKAYDHFSFRLWMQQTSRRLVEIESALRLFVSVVD